MKIVVTGKHGTGKTSILNNLSDEFNLYNMDSIVKEMYISNHELINKISLEFPKSFKKNKIDIEILKDDVLNSKERFELLKKITQPFIIEFIKKTNNDVSIFEMAGYMSDEKIYKNLFDKVILINRNNIKNNYKNDAIKIFKQIEIKSDFEISNNFDLQTSSNKIKELILKWKLKYN